MPETVLGTKWVPLHLSVTVDGRPGSLAGVGTRQSEAMPVMASVNFDAAGVARLSTTDVDVDVSAVYSKH